MVRQVVTSVAQLSVIASMSFLTWCHWSRFGPSSPPTLNAKEKEEKHKNAAHPLTAIALTCSYSCCRFPSFSDSEMRVFSSNPHHHGLHLASKYLAVLLENGKIFPSRKKKKKTEILCYFNGKANIWRCRQTLATVGSNVGEGEMKWMFA